MSGHPRFDTTVLSDRYRYVKARAAWLRHAGPIGYALTATDAAAALPVVGRHLAPLGTLAAAGAWVSRNHAETTGWVTGAARQVSGRHGHPPRVAGRLQALSAEALHGSAIGDGVDEPWPPPDYFPPFVHALAQRKRYLHRAAVPYGAEPHQRIDVWRRPDLPADGRAPVMVFVPGGAWLLGGRQLQGYALMSHLVERGWICLSAEYGAAPRFRWPRHVRDVRTAVRWTREHVAEYGGDPDFVTITGCSAGAHIASLIGLAGDDPYFDADRESGSAVAVEAVVGLYGRYDWVDRSTTQRQDFVQFLEDIVVRKRMDRHRDVFEAASPIARVRPDAPPFLVIHGDADKVIPAGEARAFAESLRSVSNAAVHYLEIPDAGHGFDLTDPWSTQAAIRTTASFLDAVHRSRRSTTGRRRAPRLFR